MQGMYERVLKVLPQIPGPLIYYVNAGVLHIMIPSLLKELIVQLATAHMMLIHVRLGGVSLA